MKKVLILGVGAQGSTVARKLEEEPTVGEVICADYDGAAVDGLVKLLKKARGAQVDASRKEDIVKLAKGVDLIVNALPVELSKNVLEAALEVKTDYQDFAIPGGLVEENPEENWADGVKILYDAYGKRFAAIGRTALVGTGSAPGLMCVAARRAVRELDRCETIYMFVYEGAEAKRFLPFWWSPVVALGDMMYPAVAYENGEIVKTEPFSRPVSRKFPELGGLEIDFIEHAHDEPVYMGANAETFFKGAKNIYFKYGGVGIGFAKPLYRAGLLSKKAVRIGDQQVVPFDVVLAHIPPAPKFREEIQEILDEGLVGDSGAFVVEAYGQKDGKDVKVELHLSAPGMMEAFEKSGMTGEMYQTGQCGFLFTKMFLEDKFTQRGLISSDMMTEAQNDYYLEEAAKLELTFSIEVSETG